MGGFLFFNLFIRYHSGFIFSKRTCFCVEKKDVSYAPKNEETSEKKCCTSIVARILFQRLYNWKPVLGDKLPGISIGRGFDVLKGGYNPKSLDRHAIRSPRLV